MKHDLKHPASCNTNQNTLQLLQKIFEAPPPRHKEAFIRNLPQPRLNCLSFMLLQAGYMPRWIWVLSAVLLALSLAAACLLNQDILYILSAMIPFAAVSSGIESGRSQIYAMEELEMSSRFSLKSVLLARMGILGISHLILLGFLIPLGSIHSPANLLQTGVCLLTPYLASTVTGLWISRKIRGKEAVYAYLGAATAVSGIQMYLQTTLPEYYQTNYFHRQIVLLLLLTAATIYESIKIIQETEELRWNLS